MQFSRMYILQVKTTSSDTPGKSTHISHYPTLEKGEKETHFQEYPGVETYTVLVPRRVTSNAKA